MLNSIILDNLKAEILRHAKDCRFSEVSENIYEIRFQKDFGSFGYSYHAEIINLVNRVLIRDWIYQDKTVYKFSGFLCKKEDGKTFAENARNALVEYSNSGEIEKTFKILEGV